MPKYWRLMGEYDAEGTTFSACAGAAQTSPYIPDADGRLIGLRVIPARTAATTLLDHAQFRLTCSMWTPNECHCGVSGSGIQTAPAAQPMPVDFEVDQPVKAGVPIKVEGRCILANAVTVDILVYGLFSS